MIKAKPVVPDQYWILQEHNSKVGNIQADHGGFTVSLHGERTRFDTLNVLAKRFPIVFETITTSKQINQDNQVHGYPTTEKPHNAMFDVRYQLPLWTQTEYSKSWFAAGWYRVQQHRDWTVMQCPKLIVLQRYDYKGPFHTIEEARGA